MTAVSLPHVAQHRNTSITLKAFSSQFYTLEYVSWPHEDKSILTVVF